MTEAIIDPRLKLHYHTFVLQGLLDLGFSLRFRRMDAPAGDGMAMSVGGQHIWVDTNDHARVEPEPYQWCDVFGKVNLRIEECAEHGKIRMLGPVFGIRLWGLPAGYLQIRHFLRPGLNARSALAHLRYQGITRLPIDAFTPGESQTGYAFHRSRAWAGKHTGTNDPRARFIEALEQTPIRGEAALTDDRLPLRAWLENTARSSVVFSCPAVHGCLGWKLGEYLALGKAIISTALGRALPAPLVHGEHIHFVDDDVDAMRDAILHIDGDLAYRRRLERGARAWYEENMSPTVVAGRLVAG